jgi:hypothetical protein
MRLKFLSLDLMAPKALNQRLLHITDVVMGDVLADG